MKVQKILLLENIRSAQNVGAILRTADAVGVDTVYLIGYTPAPIDRFGREQKEIAKSALGAEQTIVWKQVATCAEVIEERRSEGFTFVALEQTGSSVDYKEFIPNEKTALIVGNEVDGVSDETLRLVDAHIEIPMYGKKESLNVSVAAGVALYRLFDR